MNLFQAVTSALDNSLAKDPTAGKLPLCLTVVVVVQLLSHVQLFCSPWTVAHQTPLSVGFSSEEYWCGLPSLSPGDLSDPGIEPSSPASAGRSVTAEPRRKPRLTVVVVLIQNRRFAGNICLELNEQHYIYLKFLQHLNKCLRLNNQIMILNTFLSSYYELVLMYI